MMHTHNAQTVHTCQTRYVNHDPRLIFKARLVFKAPASITTITSDPRPVFQARLVFKARLLFEEIRYYRVTRDVSETSSHHQHGTLLSDGSAGVVSCGHFGPAMYASISATVLGTHVSSSTPVSVISMLSSILTCRHKFTPVSYLY